jgi:hypothetical protein
MKKISKTIQSFDELEKIAMDTTDIRPMSRAARAEWEAAKRTGSKVGRRQSNTKKSGSRIVPISLDSLLLEKVDRYASSAGLSRSRVVAEALELRIGG